MFVINHGQQCLARTEVWVVLAYFWYKRCLDSWYTWKNCVAEVFNRCYDLLNNRNVNMLVCQREITPEVTSYNPYYQFLLSASARNDNRFVDSVLSKLLLKPRQRESYCYIDFISPQIQKEEIAWVIANILRISEIFRGKIKKNKIWLYTIIFIYNKAP